MHIDMLLCSELLRLVFQYLNPWMLSVNLELNALRLSNLIELSINGEEYGPSLIKVLPEINCVGAPSLSELPHSKEGEVQRV